MAMTVVSLVVGVDLDGGRTVTAVRIFAVAVAALFVLSACTPEEISAVEAHYRASVEAETQNADGPTWSVDADCGGAHIVITEWTGADVSPSTGLQYVSLGLGATNIGVGLDESGSVDWYAPADQRTANTPAWSWSLVINGDPGLLATGIADC